MLLKSKEKKERALGTKLFLKGERCSSLKCAMIRRPYRPGQHGKRRHSVSDFARQLKEKQKIQISFGLRDRQMRELFKNMAVTKRLNAQAVLNRLESRFDNVIFRLGFAPARIAARQLVSHGHFLINNRKVTIPSYAVKVGDKISIREGSRSSKVFGDLPLKLKKYEAPDWIKVDKDKFIGEIIKKPEAGETLFDPNLVMEYYSR
ncbi:MAG: 30S ribosomal protein S4 [Candidatus Brennerbacteria bacterium]|nr:30S ribosomal protein S4 [Candidatus Brennerbacteria bacterium]